jgi:flagellar hook-associated protein 3 FlgL
MSTRITDFSLVRSLTADISMNREFVNRYSNEVSSGLKVSLPGDSSNAATISQYQLSLQRVEGYKNRSASVKSYLELQDDVMATAGDLLIRAKEIATQAANQTVSDSARKQMAQEVFQIRDHMVALANTTYQGKYVFGGVDDDDPPYDQVAPYVDPGTGPASVRYQYDVDPGSQGTRSVPVSDDVSVVVNTPGDQIFTSALEGLERLGRALDGYATDPPPPGGGTPVGTGTAYIFPQDYQLQTEAIRHSIDLFDRSRAQEIQIERVSLGGRLRRLDTAASVLELTKVAAEDVLDKLQNADIAESGTKLAHAQTALQASMTVTTRVLGRSILDFL